MLVGSMRWVVFIGAAGVIVAACSKAGAPADQTISGNPASAFATAVRVEKPEPNDPDMRFVTQFAWPVPSSAQVEMRIIKRGLEGVARYQMHVHGSGGTDVLRVSFTDFAFSQTGALDPVEQQRAQGLGASFEELEIRVPTLFVSTDGEYVDLDWNAVAETTERVLLKQGVTDDPERARQLGNLLPSGIFKGMMRRAGMGPWNTWVALWRNDALPNPGIGIESNDARGHTVIKNHGLTQDGLVALSLVVRSESSEAGEVEGEGWTAREVMTSNEIITNPETLVPTYAKLERREWVRAYGTDTQTYDLREYLFRWE